MALERKCDKKYSSRWSNTQDWPYSGCIPSLGAERHFEPYWHQIRLWDFILRCLYSPHWRKGSKITPSCLRRCSGRGHNHLRKWQSRRPFTKILDWTTSGSIWILSIRTNYAFYSYFSRKPKPNRYWNRRCHGRQLVPLWNLSSDTSSESLSCKNGAVSLRWDICKPSPPCLNRGICCHFQRRRLWWMESPQEPFEPNRRRCMESWAHY